MSHPGKVIATLRERFDLTQAELAKKAKTSRAYLARIETERHNPSIEVLDRISKVFDLPTAYFFLDRSSLPDEPIYDTLTKLLDKLVNLKVASRG